MMRCWTLSLLICAACARPSPLSPAAGDQGDWRAASFFNRVRHQVNLQWHPGATLHRLDPTGALYGYSNRSTTVRATLMPTGQMLDVVVLVPSGVGFLDEEAIRAFRAAQPFPDPPEGLIDPKDGLIHFPMGMLLDLSRERNAKR